MCIFYIYIPSKDKSQLKHNPNRKSSIVNQQDHQTIDDCRANGHTTIITPTRSKGGHEGGKSKTPKKSKRKVVSRVTTTNRKKSSNQTARRCKTNSMLTYYYHCVQNVMFA